MIGIHILLLFISVGYYLFYANMYLVSYMLSIIHGSYILFTRGLPMTFDFFYNITYETGWRMWPYLRWPLSLALIYLCYSQIRRSYNNRGDDYNCQKYLNRYADLRKSLGKDCKDKATEDKAKYHWENFGKKEGRIAN